MSNYETPYTAFHNADLETAKSNKIANSYYDISVDPKQPVIRKGKVLLNNKIYHSGRNKVKSENTPDDISRNKAVKLR